MGDQDFMLHAGLDISDMLPAAREMIAQLLSIQNAAKGINTAAVSFDNFGNATRVAFKQSSDAAGEMVTNIIRTRNAKTGEYSAWRNSTTVVKANADAMWNVNRALRVRNSISGDIVATFGKEIAATKEYNRLMSVLSKNTSNYTQTHRLLSNVINEKPYKGVTTENDKKVVEAMDAVYQSTKRMSVQKEKDAIRARADAETERKRLYENEVNTRRLQRSRRADRTGGILEQLTPTDLKSNAEAMTQINRVNKQIVEGIATGAYKASHIMRGLAQMRRGESLSGISSKEIAVLQQYSKATEAAVQNNQRFSRSIAEIAKNVFVYETLYRVIYGILYAIKDSVRAAIDFEVKIAEIRTIGQSMPQTYKQWSDQVIKLSDAFGLPAADVAEGVYQTISNQVALGERATSFMVDSQYLAAAAVSNTADSVNYLSSIINAFGKEAGDAFEIAAKGFKTVELGRVRLNEMSDVIGRSASMARLLGVSFEEMNAAFVAMTIQGVKFTEAQTGFTNMLMRMLKPNKEMIKVLKEMRYESFASAIAALGLQKVLQRMFEISGKSNTELAKSFSNMRGLRGVSLVLGEGADKFTEAMEAQKSPTLYTQYTKAYTEVLENAGKRTQIELNKIKNFFMYDIGVSAIETLSSLGNSFVTLSTAVKIATEAVIAFGAVAAWGKIITNMRLMTSGANAMKAAGVGMVSLIGRTALTAVGAVGTTIAAGVILKDIMDSMHRNAVEAEEKIADTQLNLFKANSARITAENEEEWKKRTQALLQYMATLRGQQATELDMAKKIWTDYQTRFKDALANNIKTIGEGITALKTRLSGITTDIDKLKKQSTTLADKWATDTFERNLKRTTSQRKKYNLTIAETERLTRQSVRTASLGDNDEAISLLIQARDAWNKLLDETTSVQMKVTKARGTKKRGAQRDASEAKSLESLINDARIAAEEAVFNEISNTVALRQQQMIATQREIALRKGFQDEVKQAQATYIAQMKTAKDDPRGQLAALKEAKQRIEDIVARFTSAGMQEEVGIKLLQDTRLVIAAETSNAHLLRIVEILNKGEEFKRLTATMEEQQKQGNEYIQKTGSDLIEIKSQISKQKLELPELGFKIVDKILGPLYSTFDLAGQKAGAKKNITDTLGTINRMSADELESNGQVFVARVMSNVKDDLIKLFPPLRADAPEALRNRQTPPFYKQIMQDVQLMGIGLSAYVENRQKELKAQTAVSDMRAKLAENSVAYVENTAKVEQTTEKVKTFGDIVDNITNTLTDLKGGGGVSRPSLIAPFKVHEGRNLKPGVVEYTKSKPLPVAETSYYIGRGADGQMAEVDKSKPGWTAYFDPKITDQIPVAEIMRKNRSQYIKQLSQPYRPDTFVDTSLGKNRWMNKGAEIGMYERAVKHTAEQAIIDRRESELLAKLVVNKRFTSTKKEELLSMLDQERVITEREKAVVTRQKELLTLVTDKKEEILQKQRTKVAADYVANRPIGPNRGNMLSDFWGMAKSTLVEMYEDITMFDPSFRYASVSRPINIGPVPSMSGDSRQSTSLDNLLYNQPSIGQLNITAKSNKPEDIAQAVRDTIRMQKQNRVAAF